MARRSIWAPVRRTMRRLRLVDGRQTVFRRPMPYIAAGVFVLVTYVVISDRLHVFTLNTSTEVASFTVTDPVLAEWTLGPTRLLEDRFADLSQARCLADRSMLAIEPGTRVRVQRHGVGVVRIRLVREADDDSVGRIELADDRPIALGDWALLLVEAQDRPLVLPFRGTLAVGEDVAVGVESTLVSGTVSVVEQQLFGKTHYIAGVEQLDPGDRVRLLRHPVERRGGPEPAKVSGFVRAEPAAFSEADNALSLVAHGSADYVDVQRLGTAGYHIRAPHWARFVHDPFLAAATALVALVALLLELLSKGVTLFSGASGPERERSDDDDD